MEQERELSQQPEVPRITARTATGDPGGPFGSATAQHASSNDEQTAIESTAQLATIGEGELQQQVVKKPIFIGTTNPMIVKSVEYLLFHPSGDQPPVLSRDEYVLCVIHHSVQQSLFQQYRFNEMQVEEQQRINRTKAADAIREQAFRTAMELEYRIQTFRNKPEHARYFQDHPEELMEINYGELKAILNGTRTGKGARATRQDTWVLMDLLVLQGY